MSSTVWSVWSWDTQNLQWLEVSEGTKAEMTKVLARKEAAAKKHLPSARFAATPQNKPPQYIPDMEYSEFRPDYDPDEV